MKGPFPLYLGLRNLLGRRRRLSPHLLGSILGIALSLVPLIVVMEVADGMIEGITRRYLEVGTYHAQVLLPMADASALQAEAEALRSQPGVRYALVEQQGLGLAAGPKGRSAVTIRAVPADLYAQDEGFRRYFRMEAGAFDLASAGSLLLGRELAGRLGVGVGDRLRLLTLRGSDRGSAIAAPKALGSLQASGRGLPLVSNFTVRGIFSTGYQELDKLWVYVPLTAAGRLLGESGGERFIGLKLDDPFRGLERRLSRLRLPEEAQVYSWYQLEKASYKSFQTTRALLLFIMALIVAVAAVNVSSSRVRVVLEKTQEIAMLKAMGAGPWEIGLAFTVTAAATGLAGTALGLALGALVAVNINALLAELERILNLAGRAAFFLLSPFLPLLHLPPPPAVRLFNAEFYLEKIPVTLSFRELAAVAAATMLLAILAAWLPARRASAIRPLEVLRRA
jgi:lipoprotein-releasing system permease protein